MTKMNKTDRTELARLTEEASVAIAELSEFMDGKRDDIQEVFDGRSERWQESERGDAAQERISRFEDFVSELETFRDTIEGFDPDEE